MPFTLIEAGREYRCLGSTSQPHSTCSCPRCRRYQDEIIQRNRAANEAAYGPRGAHEHVWGPLTRSHFAGTVHRKCEVAGCSWINAYDEEGDSDD